MERLDRLFRKRRPPEWRLVLRGGIEASVGPPLEMQVWQMTQEAPLVTLAGETLLGPCIARLSAGGVCLCEREARQPWAALAAALVCLSYHPTPWMEAAAREALASDAERPPPEAPGG